MTKDKRQKRWEELLEEKRTLDKIALKVEMPENICMAAMSFLACLGFSRTGSMVFIWLPGFFVALNFFYALKMNPPLWYLDEFLRFFCSLATGGILFLIVSYFI